MEDFLEFWLEDIMRPEMTDPSYVAYRNAIVKHINPHLGNTKLIKLSRGNVQQFYNKEFKISESVAKLVKTIMNTSMVYALDKKMISVNPAEGSDLPKQKKKTEFRTRHIDEQKTLNQKSIFYNMKTYYKAHTQKDNGLAGCMECGQCENICPQKISIRKYFGEIKQLFE